MKLAIAVLLAVAACVFSVDNTFNVNFNNYIGGGFKGGDHDREEIEIEGDITSSVTWKRHNTYIIEGIVRVKSPAVLTIEAGTTVFFAYEPFDSTKAPEDQVPSSLIIEAGAKIIAEGTKQWPIKFLVEYGTGTFGFLGIFGNDKVTGGPLSWTLADGTSTPYGSASTDTTSSGVLKYIIFGGLSGYGVAGGSIVLGGVGSETEISHIFISNGWDDGFDIDGGSVDLSYIRVDVALDDGIDISKGYTGTISNFEVSSSYLGSALETSDGITFKDGTISFVYKEAGADFDAPLVRGTFGNAVGIVATLDNVKFVQYGNTKPDVGAENGASGSNNRFHFVNPSGSDVIAAAASDVQTGSAPAATGWRFGEAEKWW